MGLANRLSKLVSTETKKPLGNSKKVVKETASVPISPTEYGPETVLPKKESSKNFQKKFKETKVVDENQKPALLYHGRTKDYEAFDTSGNSSVGQEIGTHLGTQAQANDFATYYGGNVVPAYVDIKNPLRLEDRGGFQPIEVLEQLRDEGFDETLINAIDALPEKEQSKAVIDLIKSKGYDGIVYLNRREGLNIKGSDKEVSSKLDEIADYDDETLRQEYGAKDSYIIFDPAQAKSPFNKGTYSETDDRFNYNKGGSVDTMTDYTMQQPADTGSIQHGVVSEPTQPTIAPILTPKFAMAKGGQVANQTSRMLKEGGMMQDGGTVDPESGNKVPVGAMQEEVRDDIPAQLSEGEFVFPADVVRYIGLERLMQMRQAAKKGLMQMEEMGQMSNGEEGSEEEDTAEFESQIDEIMGEMGEEEPTAKMAEGGMAMPNDVTQQTQQAFAQQPMQPAAASAPMAPAPAAPTATPAPTPEQPSVPTSQIIREDIQREGYTPEQKVEVDKLLSKVAGAKAVVLREKNTVLVGSADEPGYLTMKMFSTDTPEDTNAAVVALVQTLQKARIKGIRGETKNEGILAEFEALGYKPEVTEANGTYSYTLDMQSKEEVQ